MGKNVKVDIKGLEKFRDKLEQIDVQEFCEAAAKELASRLLRKVIKRTPVGDYGKYLTADDGTRILDKKTMRPIVIDSDAKTGGTLRRGWTTQLQNIRAEKRGSNYVVELINPTEYASYVEYGHRQEPGRYVPAIGKRLKKGWVEGQFMLTISENEIREQAPGILEKKLNKWLTEVLSDD